MSIQVQEEQGSFIRQLLSPLVTFYKAKIITVEPIFFLFLLSYMLYTTIIEQYYYQYYGAELLRHSSFESPNGSYCINSTVIDDYANTSYKQDETDSNDLLIYTELASKLPAIPVTIFMAPLTDRYGRKIGIVIPTVGFLIQSIASILIIYYNINPFYLIAASGVSGLCGDYASLTASIFSYAVDVSSVKTRSIRLAAIGGALSFGHLVGVLSGGYWLATINCNFIPVITLQAAVLGFIILYTLALPESRSKLERLQLLAKKKGTILSKYTEGVKLYCSRFSYSVWAIYMLTLNLAVLGINLGGSVYVSVYFLKAPPFQFTSLQIGYYQAARAAGKGIGNCIMFLLAFSSIKDSWVVLYGTTVSSIGNVLHGFANKGWQIYTISGIKGTESVSLTISRSMASKQVKPEQQGALFSIIASVESLAALMASVIWPYVFPLTLKYNMRPGSSYIFMGAAEVIMILFLLSIVPLDWKKPTTKKKYDIETSLHTKNRPALESSRGDSGGANSSSEEEEEYKYLLSSSDKHKYNGSLDKPKYS